MCGGDTVVGMVAKYVDEAFGQLASAVIIDIN
jgi:hypothetical protein